MKSPPPSLLTQSLRENPAGEKASRILAAALSAVDPPRVIQESLIREGNRLFLQGEVIDLANYHRILLLSIGKAALSMSISIEDLIGDRLSEAYILTKHGNQLLPARFQKRIHFFTGNHPIPDQEGLHATTEILSRLSSLNADDLVIVLISGGSSALFTYPADGISLSDLQKTNQILLACGADIREINTIRKHLSRVKGGQLAKILQPAHTLTLILSDVIGDPIDMIGSGPTAPDPSTYANALAVVDKYRLGRGLPEVVIHRLRQGLAGKLPETPKPDDPCFRNSSTLILASNRNALQAGAEQAQAEGFNTDTLSQPLEGEASATGRNLAKRLAEMALNGKPLNRPACLIAGGETTVTLTHTKEHGLGGRNLETALSSLPMLHGLENIALITLATDGEDGVTDAAGAVVTGESYHRCQLLGLNPEDYLNRHDSYSLFKALDDLLLPGPTGTNVNDLCFLFAF